MHLNHNTQYPSLWRRTSES